MKSTKHVKLWPNKSKKFRFCVKFLSSLFFIFRRCLACSNFSLFSNLKLFRCLFETYQWFIIMMFIFFFVLAQPFLLFFFFRTTKEFPKSWREFKLEIKTIWCGFRSQNEDLVLQKRNRISNIAKFVSLKVQQNHFYISELIQLPNRVAIITGGNRGIGIHVVTKLLRCEMTVIMGEKSEIINELKGHIERRKRNVIFWIMRKQVTRPVQSCTISPCRSIVFYDV